MDKFTRAWLALHNTNGVGPRSIERLKEVYSGDIMAILGDTAEGLARRAQIKYSMAQSIVAASHTDFLEREVQLCEEQGISVVHCDLPQYPQLLREISGAAQVLYVKGSLPQGNNRLYMAVVGTRKCSHYGVKVIRDLIKAISQALPNTVIVSGLAKGIDSAAHLAALDYGLETIGVLGCGLGTIYPSENLNLAQRITQQGCLVSEFSIEERPSVHSFPVRNRTISGMSHGVLVCEAGLKSGALITANHALEHNREVFAIPGDINRDNNQGTNQLIQRGHAKLTTHLSDIVAEFPMFLVQQQQKKPQAAIVVDDYSQRIIIDVLRDEARHPDDIAQILGESIQNILAALLELELQGIVEALPDNRYALA